MPHHFTRNARMVYSWNTLCLCWPFGCLRMCVCFGGGYYRTGIWHSRRGIPDDNYYIGKRKKDIGKRKKGTVQFRDFKPLYIERQIDQEFDLQRSTVDPIYEIPTREELG